MSDRAAVDLTCSVSSQIEFLLSTLSRRLIFLKADIAVNGSKDRYWPKGPDSQDFRALADPTSDKCRSRCDLLIFSLRESYSDKEAFIHALLLTFRALLGAHDGSDYSFKLSRRSKLPIPHRKTMRYDLSFPFIHQFTEKNRSAT